MALILEREREKLTYIHSVLFQVNFILSEKKRKNIRTSNSLTIAICRYSPTAAHSRGLELSPSKRNVE